MSVYGHAGFLPASTAGCRGIVWKMEDLDLEDANFGCVTMVQAFFQGLESSQGAMRSPLGVATSASRRPAQGSALALQGVGKDGFGAQDASRKSMQRNTVEDNTPRWAFLP